MDAEPTQRRTILASRSCVRHPAKTVQKLCPSCSTLAYTGDPRCPWCGASYRRRLWPGLLALLLVQTALVLGGVAYMLTVCRRRARRDARRSGLRGAARSRRLVRRVRRSVREELDRRLPETADPVSRRHSASPGGARPRRRRARAPGSRRGQRSAQAPARRGLRVRRSNTHVLKVVYAPSRPGAEQAHDVAARHQLRRARPRANAPDRLTAERAPRERGRARGRHRGAEQDAGHRAGAAEQHHAGEQRQRSRRSPPGSWPARRRDRRRRGSRRRRWPRGRSGRRRASEQLELAAPRRWSARRTSRLPSSGSR